MKEALLRGAFVAVVLLVGAGAGPMALAQQTPAPEAGANEADVDSTYWEPYRTERSFLYHVLATPAYILHAATRPIGWGLLWIERNAPGIFEGERPTAGVYPSFELGGPSGFSGGLVAFHRDAFGVGHRVRAEAVIGSREFNDFSLEYTFPQAFGATNVGVAADYFNNPRRRFFLGGNDANDEDDEARFDVEQIDARLTFGVQPRNRLSSAFDIRYERVIVRAADGVKGERLVRADPLGFDDTDRLAGDVVVTYDLTHGPIQERTGTVLKVGVGYTHDLTSDRTRHGRYLAEVQQYVPVPFLPVARRIAVRARIEQAEPIFDGEGVPFYDLRNLGGQESLRGFVYNRFSDNGLLLLNAEYRYPIWALWDAVLFVDTGQVFDDFRDIGVGEFHTNVGAGVRVLTPGGIGFRFEVAAGADGARTLITVAPVF